MSCQSSALHKAYSFIQDDISTDKIFNESVSRVAGPALFNPQQCALAPPNIQTVQYNCSWSTGTDDTFSLACEDCLSEQSAAKCNSTAPCKGISLFNDTYLAFYGDGDLIYTGYLRYTPGMPPSYLLILSYLSMNLAKHFSWLRTNLLDIF